VEVLADLAAALKEYFLRPGAAGTQAQPPGVRCGVL
jgi:hypothetical protein